MYYFVYYINISLTRKNRLNSRFKKRKRYHSFTVLNDTLFLSGGNPYKALQFIYNKIYSVLLNAFELKEITEVQNAHLTMPLEDDET